MLKIMVNVEIMVNVADVKVCKRKAQLLYNDD